MSETDEAEPDAAPALKPKRNRKPTPRDATPKRGEGHLSIGQLYVLLALNNNLRHGFTWADGRSIWGDIQSFIKTHGLGSTYQALDRLLGLEMVEARVSMGEAELKAFKVSERLKTNGARIGTSFYRINELGRKTLETEFTALSGLGADALIIAGAPPSAKAAPGKPAGEPLAELLAHETGEAAEITQGEDGAALVRLPSGWGGEPLEIIRKPAFLALRPMKPNRLARLRGARRAIGGDQLDLLSALFEEGEAP